MLIYKRLMRWVVGSQEERHRLRRNSFTSPYLWLLSLLAVLPATLFWNRNGWLIAFVVVLYRPMSGFTGYRALPCAALDDCQEETS